MRRALVACAVTGLLAGGSSVAFAGPGDAPGEGPDPNGPAKFGLCTAYFAGQGGEHGKKNDAPPFRNLADAAEEADQTIEEFCADATPGGR